MHFLKTILLRRELTRITFNVGKVIVQEYCIHAHSIKKTLGKLHILIRFKDLLTNFEIYPVSK